MMKNRFITWLFGRKSRKAWWALIGIALLIGVASWRGFEAFVEYSDSLEFCVSCHEMNQLVYPEYKETIHYKNRTGVRVICSDCHVPKPWTQKMVRKIKASNELWHKMMGSIDTPEKFEAKRLELAENVWAQLDATNSQECRNCHAYEAMDFHKQKRQASRSMQRAAKRGKNGNNCIECHKGVAHKLPDDYEE